MNKIKSNKKNKKPFFSPTFGNRPEYLLGRELLLQELLEGLQTPPGSRGRARLITGQRGLGKTVLLLELASRAEKAGYLVASPTVVTSDLPDVILDKLQKEMSNPSSSRRKKVTGGSVGAFGFSAGLPFGDGSREARSFSLRLDAICEAVNREGKGVLILVDEVQAGSAELRKLVIAYQELVGAERDVAIVMAGLPAALSEVLNDKVMTFLNRAEKAELPPLHIAEIERYYKRAFLEEGIKVPDALIEKAAQRTQGSPYMMQLIGYYMTQLAQPGVSVTDRVFRKVTEWAEADFRNDICLTVLRAISETDVRFLRTMSALGEEVSVSGIAKTMRVSGAYAQQYRRRLLDAGIIAQVRRGYVCFAVPYLAAYLRESNGSL